MLKLKSHNFNNDIFVTFDIDIYIFRVAFSFTSKISFFSLNFGIKMLDKHMIYMYNRCCNLKKERRSIHFSPDHK